MTEKTSQDKLLVPNFKSKLEMEQLVKEYAQLCVQSASWKSVAPEVLEARKARDKVRTEHGAELRKYLKPYLKKDYGKRAGSAEEELRWIVATDFKIAEVAEKLEDKESGE